MARPAPAASRAVSILSFLTAHSSRGFTITELVRHLGMNIASAHATLAVLCDSGFVLRDPVHRTYVLGPALTATGFAALDQHPAVGAALEQADLLAVELDAEIGVSAIAGRDVVLLARRGPAPRVTTVGYVGDRAPLLAPFGAVFMAWDDDAAVSAWLERGQVSGSTASQYRRVLSEIRARGFSAPLHGIASPPVSKAIIHMRDEPVDEDAEHQLTGALRGAEEMLLCFEGMDMTDTVTFQTVAAPIFDPIGRVLLSISVSGPETPVSLRRVHELGRRLRQAAAIATRNGHGRVPEPDRSDVASGS